MTDTNRGDGVPTHPVIHCVTTTKGQPHAWRATALVAAIVLFVESATSALGMSEPHLNDCALAIEITTLRTYSPDTINLLSDYAVEYCSGDFDSYGREFLEAAVTPTNKPQATDQTDLGGWV